MHLPSRTVHMCQIGNNQPPPNQRHAKSRLHQTGEMRVELRPQPLWNDILTKSLSRKPRRMTSLQIAGGYGLRQKPTATAPVITASWLAKSPALIALTFDLCRCTRAGARNQRKVPARGAFSLRQPERGPGKGRFLAKQPEKGPGKGRLLAKRGPSVNCAFIFESVSCCRAFPVATLYVGSTGHNEPHEKPRSTS